MKNGLTDNLGIKMLSVVLSLVIWLIVVNVADPYMERTFTNIEVEVENYSALIEHGKVYDIIEGRTVNVTYRGRRSVITDMRTSDVRAAADLSELSETGHASIEVTVQRYFSNMPELVRDRLLLMKVQVENVDKKTVHAVIEPKGEVAEGYFLPRQSYPRPITVQGGESVVRRVNYIRLEVDVEGEREDFEATVEPKAYDQDGDPVVSNNLTFSPPRIPVEIKIFKKKTIPVKLNVIGVPAEGYRFIEPEVTPDRVVIAGTAEALENISEWEIELDITGMTEDEIIDVEEVDFEEHFLEFKDQVVLVDERPPVILAVIERLKTQTIYVDVTEIVVRNRPEHLDVSFPDRRFSILLTGTEGELEAFGREMLTSYIDVSGLRVGSHRLKVHCVVPEGSHILAEGPSDLAVDITGRQ